jgi:hypothetical protein
MDTANTGRPTRLDTSRFCPEIKHNRHIIVTLGINWEIAGLTAGFQFNKLEISRL